MLRQAARFLYDGKRDSLRFAEADVTGSMSIAFSDLVNMLPAEALEHESMLRKMEAWFNESGLAPDGNLCVNGFMVYVMVKGLVLDPAGDMYSTIFSRYDRDKTGFLDEIEWGKLCGKLHNSLI